MGISYSVCVRRLHFIIQPLNPGAADEISPQANWSIYRIIHFIVLGKSEFTDRKLQYLSRNVLFQFIPHVLHHESSLIRLLHHIIHFALKVCGRICLKVVRVDLIPGLGRRAFVQTL